MDTSPALHRFRTIETLHDGAAARLDMARDIVEDRRCWLLTPARQVRSVTETALWLRASSCWAAACPLELVDLVRDGDQIYLSLTPLPGQPWLTWLVGADPGPAARSVQAFAEFLGDGAASGVVAGALDLEAMWWSAEGPGMAPSAWLLPPRTDQVGRFWVDHTDVGRSRKEVLQLWQDLSEWILAREELGFLRPELEKAAGRFSAPPSSPFERVEELVHDGGVHILRSSTPVETARALADALRADGRVVAELAPQIRVARDLRLEGRLDALVLGGDGAYADFAVSLESLEKKGLLSGQESVFVVGRDPAGPEDLSLWLRCRTGATDPVVHEISPAIGSAGNRVLEPGPGHSGRVLEVLGLMDQGIVADALTAAFSWSPDVLATALSELLAREWIRIRYARHHASPGLHVLIQLCDDCEVKLEASRRDEVCSLIGSIAESHPDRGRGLGRQWFYAGLLAQAGSPGVVDRLRRLARRLEADSPSFMSVGVYAVLLDQAGDEPPLRADLARAAIVRAHFYQRSGQLREATGILDETTRLLGGDEIVPGKVDEALASVTLHRARLDFHVSAFAEGERRLSVLLEETRGEMPVELRSRVYVELAWAQLQLGRTRESVRTSELILRMLDAHTHADLVARAHTQLGFALYKESDYAGSVMHYDRALRLRRELGDSLAVARTLNNLGLSFRALEQWSEAEENLRESLRLKSMAGDEVSSAASLLNLGFVLMDRGRLEEATECAESCVDIGCRHHHPETEAEALGLLGEIATARGDLDAAREWLTRDLGICERTGHQSERLVTLRRLADVLFEAGEWEEAAGCLESARGLLSEQPSRLETALLDRIEADLLCHEESWEPAITAYSAAARGFATIQRPLDQAEALSRRGAVEHRLGRVDAARATLAEVRELVSRHELHSMPVSARDLEGRMGSSTRRESLSMVGPRTCLEALVAALENPGADAGLLSSLSSVFDGVDVFWIGEDGESLGPHGERGGAPEDLCVLASTAAGDGVESRGGWTLIASRGAAGMLALRMSRQLDAAEEQLLRGFLYLVRRPAARPGESPDGDHGTAGSFPRTVAEGLVGRSPGLAHVLRLVDRVAPTDVSVLLLGENGTGKELVARALHSHGPRADRPFVAVNCASIPSNLLESELFGHEKGAFTSAYSRRAGCFEEAQDGTLLLDEIGEMSPDMQSKLLRVLQERSFSRVGGSELLKSEARIIAATNRDLAAEVERGRFRVDLYYRINVVTIEIPPLRERREDIEPLVEHFLIKHAPAFGGRVPELSADVLARLQAWHWPGNVRELENVVMNALVFATADILRPEDLPAHILPSQGVSSRGDWQRAVEQLLDAGDWTGENPLLPRLETWVVHEMVRRTGNKTLAAKMLGITKPTVYDRLRRYEAFYGDEKSMEEGGG